jgi:hypothetical protein
MLVVSIIWVENPPLEAELATEVSLGTAWTPATLQSLVVNNRHIEAIEILKYIPER